MTATLSLAMFFQQSRDWHASPAQVASRALSREGMDVAARVGDDPLRGDPLSPDVVALVELIRPAGVDRGPDGGVA